MTNNLDGGRQHDDTRQSNPLFTLDSDQIDYLREGFEARQTAMSPAATRDRDAIYEHEQVAGSQPGVTQAARQVAAAAGAAAGGHFARALVSDAQASGQYYIRSPFYCDVDRILNNPFFKRTFDKTQVFSLFENDDLSRRGFHIQLVAQTAMKIGAALRLNVPLIEAIGLGHDAGHTPFGHMGEKFLSEIYNEHTGRFFNHNVHSVRALRSVAPCNLSLQAYNGILCHCGENNFATYTTAPCESFAELDRVMEECYTQDGRSSYLRPSTLEGCVVRICDILAYLGKDRQDAITANVIGAGSYEFDSFLGQNNSQVIENATTNIIKNSIGRDCICMDEEVSDEIRRLKKVNFQQVYNYDTATGSKLTQTVRPMMREMYENLRDALVRGDESSPIFAHHVHAWFIENRNKGYVENNSTDDIVCDFIASMTDDYFIELYRHLFPSNPKSAMDLYVHYFD